MAVLSRRIDRVHGVTALGADGQVDRKQIVIPPGYFDLFDPFLMLAEDWFSSAGFDWHPHRGIETVTVVLDGALEHGDNRGNAGALEPGDVQWMTAGSGIVHRELAFKNEFVHTLQLWVNLPSGSKMVDAAYRDFSAPGSVVRGDNWPVQGREVVIEPGQSVAEAVPGDHRAFVYAIEGQVAVGDDAEPLAAGEVAWSDPVPGAGTATALDLRAPEAQDGPARLLVFSGRPIGERVVARGPFVMNSEAEIAQAFIDFRQGRFGDVPDIPRLDRLERLAP